MQRDRPLTTPTTGRSTVHTTAAFWIGQRAARSIPERWPAVPLLGSHIAVQGHRRALEEQPHGLLLCDFGASHPRRANFLQGLFAQDIGIALAGFCKINDLRSDGLLDAIVAVADPQGDADHLERNT